MSLTQKLSAIRTAAVDTIKELISKGRGLQHPNFNDMVLDLRDFHLNNRDPRYRNEILFPDNYRVLYISGTTAYDENDNARSLDSVFDASLGPLCEVLDIIGTAELPTYEVVLRAIVIIDDALLPDVFEFPAEWTVTESDTEDGRRTIRLDTLYTCQATSIAHSVSLATDHPPSLGLDDIDDFDVHVQFWVDTEQADDVKRVSPHTN